MAEWWMEGFLDRLLDPGDRTAARLRDRAVFHIVPNMNPDGSRRGHLRTNATGTNLNREWSEPAMDRSPEVFLVRQRMQEVIASGVLGEVQHVYSNFCSPGKPGQPLRDTEATMQKIRYSSELAGGSMMDQGWYALNCVRTLMDQGWYALNCVRTLMDRQLPEVVSATAQKWPFDEAIDEGMKASLQFGNGV